MLTVKSWRDIEDAALTEPILFQLVALVRRGDFTREEALIHAVLGLVSMKEKQRQAIVELLETRTRPLLIVRPGD
jgi:hypothetical protein